MGASTWIVWRMLQRKSFSYKGFRADASDAISIGTPVVM